MEKRTERAWERGKDFVEPLQWDFSNNAPPTSVRPTNTASLQQDLWVLTFNSGRVLPVHMSPPKE